MNIFIGIGSIVEVNDGDKVLKFSLAVRQNKPCYVTCVLFEPDEQVKEFIAHLARSNQMVWVQGRVASYEFKNIRKMEVVVYGSNIKPL